jgi:hypothetical protein
VLDPQRRANARELEAIDPHDVRGIEGLTLMATIEMSGQANCRWSISRESDGGAKGEGQSRSFRATNRGSGKLTALSADLDRAMLDAQIILAEHCLENSENFREQSAR